MESAYNKKKTEKEVLEMSIPRPEYPRPILQRDQWLNLNGEWEFEIDNGKNGIEKKFYERTHLKERITVPFCPESKLSGIGNTDFMNCVWYRRSVSIPEEWSGKHVILHFGAVDYSARVYVNGSLAGEHRGGYTPFRFDITEWLKEGENSIAVCAEDDIRSHNQPAGKQSAEYHSAGCFYTRTTGIWQTVWMECVDECHIKQVKTVPDTENGAVTITVIFPKAEPEALVTASASFEGKPMGTASTKGVSGCVTFSLSLKEKHLWDIGQGNLYDLQLTVEKDGNIRDSVQSYFGLRSVGLDRKALLLNGRKVFGRWVLDQGFYPDGIYTAPDDEGLKKDILYAMELGFNGARLHEKIFEPRFLYWADKLGYLVWGEHANWGLDITEKGQVSYFLPEWLEAVERDSSHPCVIGWCPFNETWDFNGRCQDDRVLEMVYRATKAVDPTRPVIDTSGNYHVMTDIFDVHDYCQDGEEFRTHYETKYFNPFEERQTYRGEPYFVSEYGGIQWSGEQKGGWGYGEAPATEEEFINRYRALTEALLKNENIMGFCYTQLYDVEQEQNGLMTYERKFKFDPDIFREINTQKAAMEE